VAPYHSLNIGAHVGDALAAVRENRRRVRADLRVPAEPVWLQQVHGAEAVDLDALERGGAARAGALRESAAASGLEPAGADAALAPGLEPARADAVVTPGLEPSRVDVALAPALEPSRADATVARTAARVCVIQVADCMPVLFAARDGSAVGAAHAGWRGLAGGVLEATVRALGVPPAGLIAWLGPAISQQHFEVGDDVRSAFVFGDAGASSAFVVNTRGRWQCDLYALARRRLAALGIGGVFGGGWCTYSDATRFFSFRRDGQCGRMAALIWLE
jgi:hypothetical protein